MHDARFDAQPEFDELVTRIHQAHGRGDDWSRIWAFLLHDHVFNRLLERAARRKDPRYQSGGVSDHEDMAQYVKMQLGGDLQRGTHTFTSREKIERWLRSVIKGRCIDFSRSPAARRTVPVGGQPPPSFMEDQRQIQQIVRRIVDAIADTLPAKERMVIHLRLAGYTKAEIARELRCSPRTVRRTFDRLRTYFDDEDLDLWLKVS